MNREANTGLNYNAQKDMIPLIGETESKGLFDSIIADAAQTEVKTPESQELHTQSVTEPQELYGVQTMNLYQHQDLMM